MTIQNEGIGYKDLDELFAKPCDLEFIIGKISSFQNILFGLIIYAKNCRSDINRTGR